MDGAMDDELEGKVEHVPDDRGGGKGQRLLLLVPSTEAMRAQILSQESVVRKSKNYLPVKQKLANMATALVDQPIAGKGSWRMWLEKNGNVILQINHWPGFGRMCDQFTDSGFDVSEMTKMHQVVVGPVDVNYRDEAKLRQFLEQAGLSSAYVVDSARYGYSADKAKNARHLGRFQLKVPDAMYEVTLQELKRMILHHWDGKPVLLSSRQMRCTMCFDPAHTRASCHHKVPKCLMCGEHHAEQLFCHNESQAGCPACGAHEKHSRCPVLRLSPVELQMIPELDRLADKADIRSSVLSGRKADEWAVVAARKPQPAQQQQKPAQQQPQQLLRRPQQAGAQPAAQSLKQQQAPAQEAGKVESMLQALFDEVRGMRGEVATIGKRVDRLEKSDGGEDIQLHAQFEAISGITAQLEAMRQAIALIAEKVMVSVDHIMDTPVKARREPYSERHKGSHEKDGGPSVLPAAAFQMRLAGLSDTGNKRAKLVPDGEEEEKSEDEDVNMSGGKHPLVIDDLDSELMDMVQAANVQSGGSPLGSSRGARGGKAHASKA